MKEYERLKKDTLHYYVNWWDNNWLANEMINLDRYDDAILFLTKTLEEFPGRSALLNSLAKAYEKSARMKEAVATYKKALEADPGNEEAKGKLKVLESR